MSDRDYRWSDIADNILFEPDENGNGIDSLSSSGSMLLHKRIVAALGDVERIAAERSARIVQERLERILPKDETYVDAYEESHLDENLRAMFDLSERAREKALSRQQDAEDLASGRKSVADLRLENGAFAFQNVEIDFDGVEVDWKRENNDVWRCTCGDATIRIATWPLNRFQCVYEIASNMDFIASGKLWCDLDRTKVIVVQIARELAEAR
jgi:hypothetical protein